MDYQQFELQKNIRDSCDEIKSSLKELYQWEKEIKEKEKLEKEQEAKESIPVIRSYAPGHEEHVENGVKQGTGVAQNNETKPKNENPSSPSNPESSKKELANISKEKGNSLVKLGQYEEAIHHYNEAIKYFDSDSIFYTNRALCFLRLEKYNECIEDCNVAIKIDAKCIKAFYRRMQAYESLGEVDKSLADCNKVLSLDPGNLDAKRSQDRIKKRKNSFNYNLSRSFQNMCGSTKAQEPTWTPIGGYMQEIPTTTKPPHLQSKKSIKRVPVEEVLTDDTHLNEIPNEVIDKLFNNNDCGSYKQVEPKAKKTGAGEKSPKGRASETKELEEEQLVVHKEEAPVRKKEVHTMPAQRKIVNVPDTPKTQAQFHASWKELTMEQKYTYFKQIEPADILKILGPGFESDTLSDILVILSDFYIVDKCDVSVLFEISAHEQMSILALFLSDQDEDALERIVKYMRENNYSEDKIRKLNSNFGTRY